MGDSNFQQRTVLLLYTHIKTSWTAYEKENYFQSYDYPPAKVLTNRTLKKWKIIVFQNLNSKKTTVTAPFVDLIIFTYLK